MVTPVHSFVLLLAARGGPSLPGGSFRLSVPHRARVQNPLPEFHAPRYPCLDLLGPAYTQRLHEDDVGKDKGYIRVPTPTKNPPPFRGQDLREAAPQSYRGIVIPAFRLSSKLAPTTLPYSVVHDSPV